MERTHNKTGSYCYQKGIICDHNMIDSPEHIFYCSGHCGKCSNGSAWEYYIKKEGRTYYKEDAKRIN